jgi:hypothetical protein
MDGRAGAEWAAALGGAERFCAEAVDGAPGGGAGWPGARGGAGLDADGVETTGPPGAVCV